MSSDPIRRRAIIRGSVQGVGFRASTRVQARRLGLSGSARNLPDGSVEVQVEGPEPHVDELIRWLNVGPVWAQVEGVQVDDVAPRGGSGFDIS